MQNTLSNDAPFTPDASASLVHSPLGRSAVASLPHSPFTPDASASLVHSWEQSWETVTIVIPNCAPEDKKNLSISVKRDTIEVKYKETVLSGKLLFPVYPDDTTWYYNSGALYIELSKVDHHKWWKCIVEGVDEKEIPLESRKKHEYPDYVQAMLDRKGEELRAAQTRPDLYNL